MHLLGYCIESVHGLLHVDGADAQRLTIGKRYEGGKSQTVTH